MAIDTRDWHRDQHNKRTGYVERSSFRLGHGEAQRRKHSAAWRRNLLIVLAVFLGIVALSFLR